MDNRPATVALASHPEGTILPVRARPAARSNEIRGAHEGMLKISVTQAPERGKANKAIIALLAGRLELKKSQIELIAGETSPKKRFLVRGVGSKGLQDRIEPFLHE